MYGSGGWTQDIHNTPKKMQKHKSYDSGGSSQSMGTDEPSVSESPVRVSANAGVSTHPSVKGKNAHRRAVSDNSALKPIAPIFDMSTSIWSHAEDSTSDLDKIVMGEHELPAPLIPQNEHTAEQNHNEKTSNSFQAVGHGQGNGGGRVYPHQTSGLLSTSRMRSPRMLHPVDLDKSTSPDTPIAPNQITPSKNQSQTKGTPHTSPTDSVLKSKSSRFNNPFSLMSSKESDPLRIPLPPSPTSRRHVSSSVTSPAMSGSPVRKTPSPSLQHRRSLSAIFIPSPLGPGFGVDDYGSDNSGLVPSPTAGYTSSPTTDSVKRLSYNTTTTTSPNGRGKKPTPFTPTHSARRNDSENRFPPLPTGRTIGLSNLPFIAASPSTIMPQDQPASSPQHVYVTKVKHTPSRCVNHGTLGPKSVLAPPLGSRNRIPLAPMQPPSPSSAQSTPPRYLNHESRSSTRHSFQSNGIYTKNDDPFVDHPPTLPHATQQSIIPSPSQASPTPLHKNLLHDERQAIRQAWIRMQAARIVELHSALKDLQNEIDSNPSTLTPARMAQASSIRAELEQATSADFQQESRRALFMPAGTRPLRTQDAQDASLATQMLRGSANGGATTTTNAGLQNQNQNRPHAAGSQTATAQEQPFMHLLGTRMAIMERQSHIAAALFAPAAGQDPAMLAAKQRIFAGLDGVSKKVMRENLICGVRAATQCRIAQKENKEPEGRSGAGAGAEATTAGARIVPEPVVEKANGAGDENQGEEEMEQAIQGADH